MFQVFHMYVASVLFGCGMCLQWLSSIFASVSVICCKGFSYFEYMLQVFYLNIAKVDVVLHMLQCDPPATAACCSCWGATEQVQTSGRGKWKGSKRSLCGGREAWATSGAMRSPCWRVKRSAVGRGNGVHAWVSGRMLALQNIYW